MYAPKLIDSLKTYNRSNFIRDLTAGVTVGLIALPLAMAFAIASGLPPERGLFTAIVAGFIISALGGSQVQIGGPTGAFVVIVSGIAVKFGYEGLVVCTIMAGLILIGFGIFRMGGMIKFIPYPVTTGFTSGIAVVIFSTQVKDLFGLKMETPPAEFIAKWISYFQHITDMNGGATFVGLSTITVIIISRRLWPRLPSMLIGMFAGTALCSVLGLDIDTIGSRFGDLPHTLPIPTLPTLANLDLRELVSPALAIALLASIESLLSATVADGMIGDRHRPDTELIGQGIANIASAIFGGIPATGAIARTATNVKSGGATPVAGIIHAATLALLLLFFASLAKMIPLASLAGILVVVSYNMSEANNFLRLFRAPRSDILVLLTTFGLTIFVDLIVAVEVGVVLASLLFIRRMSEVSNMDIITRDVYGDEDETVDPNPLKLRLVPEGVEVFEIQGPFFFGAAERFKDAISFMNNPPKVIILRVRKVSAIDATGLHALGDFINNCKKDGSVPVLSGLHAQPLIAMERSGLLTEIGEDNIFGNIDDALNHARNILGLPPVERPTPFVPTVKREAKGETAAKAKNSFS